MIANIIIRYARIGIKPLNQLSSSIKTINTVNSPLIDTPKPVKLKKNTKKNNKTLDSGDFPPELKKIGISKKKLDDESLKMYKKMKEKGAEELVSKVIDKYIQEGNSSDDIIDDLLLKKPKPEHRSKDLFLGKQSFDSPKEKQELPEDIQQKISKEMKQYVKTMQDFQLNLYKQKDLQKSSQAKVKEIVKKDIEKADDQKVSKTFKDLPEAGEEIVESKYFDQMIKSLPEFQKRYFYELAKKDKAKLASELKKL
jgi:hypothetical protein